MNSQKASLNFKSQNKTNLKIKGKETAIIFFIKTRVSLKAEFASGRYFLRDLLNNV